MSVSWDDRLKEDSRRKQRTKLGSRLCSFGGDARMYDLRSQRVAHRGFSDRLGKVTTTTRGSNKECLNRGGFRTGFVEAYISAKEPRQREHFLQLCRKFPQIDEDLGTGCRDQCGLWH